MHVYAITDTDDRFLMFITVSTSFAHTNAHNTRRIYCQNVVAYEVNGKRFDFNKRPRTIPDSPTGRTGPDTISQFKPPGPPG